METFLVIADIQDTNCWVLVYPHQHVRSVWKYSFLVDIPENMALHMSKYSKNWSEKLRGAFAFSCLHGAGYDFQGILPEDWWDQLPDNQKFCIYIEELQNPQRFCTIPFHRFLGSKVASPEAWAPDSPQPDLPPQCWSDTSNISHDHIANVTELLCRGGGSLPTSAIAHIEPEPTTVIRCGLPEAFLSPDLPKSRTEIWEESFEELYGGNVKPK